MLRIVRVALLVVLTFVVLSFVVAIGRPETGPVEKCALAVGVVGLLVLARPVRKIGASA